MIKCTKSSAIPSTEGSCNADIVFDVVRQQ